MKRIFTNGCFDILHVGHVRLLKKAKSLGDHLIVGLNSDNSVKENKGNSRPINLENDRKEMLLSLESVDTVIIFDDKTPCELIKRIKPNVIVKGGDYDPNDFTSMPEAKIVKEYGGEVFIYPLVENKSTTNVIEKLRRK